jgi:uroporphyrinogen decarboxylase
MTALELALARKNEGRPPVWFMRQAGRYHSHYQGLKAQHSFMDLCKTPALACEVTMGPIRDFNFDAAILFSDLLFPLEAMGMGLTYEPGPKLGWHLKSREDLARLQGGAARAQMISFQEEALRLLTLKLPPTKGLIGFVGGPMTLFSYAVCGGHAGDLDDARQGLTDGRYAGFTEKLRELLVANMSLQIRGGAQALAVFDTSAGEFSLDQYKTHGVPELKRVFEDFKSKHPGTPVIYYSRGTGPAHWELLKGLPIACLGIDWHHDLPEVLKTWTPHFAIQGNVDPEWLHLPADELEKRLKDLFQRVRAAGRVARQAWVCGLGHGVLQKTPEDNVRLFMRIQKKIFGEDCG